WNRAEPAAARRALLHGARRRGAQVAGAQRDAAVLLPAALGVAEAQRVILAVADDLQILVGHAERAQVADHRLGAPLAERLVVRLRAALVGVALDGELRGAAAEALGVARQRRLGGVGELIVVEREVHAHDRAALVAGDVLTLRRRARHAAEVAHRLGGGGRLRGHRLRGHRLRCARLRDRLLGDRLRGRLLGRCVLGAQVLRRGRRSLLMRAGGREQDCGYGKVSHGTLRPAESACAVPARSVRGLARRRELPGVDGVAGRLVELGGGEVAVRLLLDEQEAEAGDLGRARGRAAVAGDDVLGVDAAVLVRVAEQLDGERRGGEQRLRLVHARRAGARRHVANREGVL